MKKNRTIIILILVLLIGIIGLTVAYFANSTSLDNIFQTKPYGTIVEETFTSPSNWLPGDEITKEITATNTGEVDQAVRISFTEGWTPNKAGSTLNGWIHEDGTKSSHTTESELANDEKVAIINFDNLDDWTYENGYYYYKYKLSPNEETSSLIKSVTFNAHTKLDDTCVTTEGNGTKIITCNSSGADYDNATYTLAFTVETVQYDKYADAWELPANTTVSIAETKQRMIKGLKVNNSDAVFATGDKTAMFEFSHPATAQTPALTDYRYIGNIPNNYVKFNCDNDGTNCEIWRIIGVFDVDDGDGNYEQRIKLVRGSALEEKMQGDDRECEGCDTYPYQINGRNEWNGSKLNIFLNGDYLTRKGNASDYGLKDLAQSQISDAKYYLGGGYRFEDSDENDTFGSTEDIYIWERGTEVYNQNEAERAVSWNGKVGLLYPSDNYFVYSKEVDIGCYNNPIKCYYFEGSGTSNDGNYNYPESGWLYNGVNLVFLLSPASKVPYSVFVVDNGKLDINGISIYYGVLPVVYLKSSIQITGGEGTEQNPYTLSQ